MKTDRWPTRAAALVLAGLLLAAGRPAASQITVNLGGIGLTFGSSSKKVAKALAQQVKEVQKRFDDRRSALRAVQLPDGKPAVLRKDLDELILDTKNDVHQAIEKVGPQLGPLDDWAKEEIQRTQEDLARVGRTASSSTPRAVAPRAVAVIASLHGLPLGLASLAAAAAPRQDAVPAAASNHLLDQVESVISRLFFLSSHDDLEVKVWVGSTAPHASFSFWSQGQIKGAAPASQTIRTDGKKSVVRGLYAYKASRADGAVTEWIQYPNLAGAPPAQTASERLDLVNGSSFFCCRFGEHYCHHVDNDKECRP